MAGNLLLRRYLVFVARARRNGARQSPLDVGIEHGRSNPVPSLGTSAGARLTVRRRCGNWNPALRIDARTRSRASWMALSVSPTMVKLGRPGLSIGLLSEKP
jgi:hypothetical protein